MKKKKKSKPNHQARCKEHSCPETRKTLEGFCSKHRDPKERHHDKKLKQPFHMLNSFGVSWTMVV